jgi:hypothetical protein
MLSEMLEQGTATAEQVLQAVHGDTEAALDELLQFCAHRDLRFDEGLLAGLWLDLGGENVVSWIAQCAEEDGRAADLIQECLDWIQREQSQPKPKSKARCRSSK